MAPSHSTQLAGQLHLWPCPLQHPVLFSAAVQIEREENILSQEQLDW